MHRHLAILALATLSGTLYAQTRPHPYDLQDVKWQVVLDEPNKSVVGDITNRIKPNVGTKEVWFDRGELKINSVRVDGVAAANRVAGEKLYVTLPAGKRDGRAVDIRIRYNGRPRAGLYFIPAKRAFPAKTPSIYTQGEMEDNRFWLVTYDYPDDKATSEGTIDVPKGYFALSNGRHVDTVHTGNRSIFHWKMDQPHVTYLIAFVAGPYEKGHEQWGSLPVDWYVPQGLKEMGASAFDGTADMVRLYSELTGFRYPYAKFSQVVVPDYMFGGMENITMVTNTIHSLHPRSAKPLADSEGLVLHELAHQWFGDTVTTNGWADGWINEGWASFLPSFYARHKPPTATNWSGEDAFTLSRYDTFNGGLGAHQAKPYRGMVYAGYKDPLDMFDGFLYPGGASRMFMLMHMLGEEKFWAACKQYLNERKYTSFDTKAFFKTWSKATGGDLTGFMNQWFFTPEAPHLQIDWSGSDVVITQTTKHVFDLDLDVWVLDGSNWIKKRVRLMEHEVRVPFPGAAGKPVLVDPEVWVMSEFDYKNALTLNDKIALFQNAPNAGSKARVMDKFLRALDAEDALAFAKNIPQEPLLARYLGEVRPAQGGRGPNQPRPNAEEWLRSWFPVLTAGMGNAAMDRLSSFPSLSNDTLTELRSVYQSDPNVLRRQTAFRTLLKVTAAESLAEEGWRKDSYNDGFRTAALDWWVDKHPGAARLKCLEVMANPPSEPVRVNAIRYLGRLKDLPGEKRAYKALLEVLKEDSFGARNTAINALAEYGDKAAIPAIRLFLKHPLVFFRQTSAGAIKTLGG
ncbi:MAG: M1 family aminopeptidase [Fimbriimonas sp.]